MWLTKRIFEFLALFSTLFLAFLTKNIKCDHEGSSDPLDWLRDAVPGEPGVDYPIFSAVGDSSFSCADRVFGGKTYHNFFDFMFLNASYHSKGPWNSLLNFPCHTVKFHNRVHIIVHSTEGLPFNTDQPSHAKSHG